MTGSAETRDEDLVVLVDVVEATIAGDEGGDLLAVLDELNTDALTDSGVGLLGLDTDLLEHDALGHGGATHGVGLHGGDGMGLAVLLIPPALGAPVSSELAAGVDSLRLAHLVLSPLVSAKKMKVRATILQRLQFYCEDEKRKGKSRLGNNADSDYLALDQQEVVTEPPVRWR